MDGQSSLDRHEMSGPEARARSKTALKLLSFRQLILKGSGALASVLIAASLPPDQYGLIVVGVLVLAPLTMLVESGLVAPAVRSKLPLSHEATNQLQSVGLTLSLFATTAAVGLTVIGVIEPATLVVVAASIPLSFRTTAVACLERQLEYRPIVLYQTSEILVYLGFVLVVFIGSLDVLALSLAYPARTAIGSTVLLLSGRKYYRGQGLRPFSAPTRLIASELTYTLKHQAASWATLARDQGIVLAALAIGGPAGAGIWGLAWRFVQSASIVLSPIRQVAFAAYSRMASTRLPLSPTVVGVIHIATLGIAWLASLLAVLLLSAWDALAPAWPGLPSLVALAAFSLVISGGATSVLIPVLLAQGRASAVLRAATWSAMVALVAALVAVHVGSFLLLAVGLALGAVANIASLARTSQTRGVLVRIIGEGVFWYAVAIGPVWLFHLLSDSNGPLALAAQIGSLAVVLVLSVRAIRLFREVNPGGV